MHEIVSVIIACVYFCIYRWKGICCLLTHLHRTHRSDTSCMALDRAHYKMCSHSWRRSEKVRRRLTSTCWRTSLLWPPGPSRAVPTHSQATCGTWTMTFRWNFTLISDKLQIQTPENSPLHNELRSAGPLRCLKVTLCYISIGGLLEETSARPFIDPEQANITKRYCKLNNHQVLGLKCRTAS